MKYEQRIVAFIDILGFKNAIEKSNTDDEEYERILRTLKKLKERFVDRIAQEGDKRDYNVNKDNQYIQVSDSLIISRPIDEPGGFSLFLADCAFAMRTLLFESGFLCRGAITFGNLYHKGTIIFGEAFIKAYQEEPKAKFPIIKFNEELIHEIKKYPRPFYSVNEEEKFIKEICRKIEIQNSFEYYIDYFTDSDDYLKNQIISNTSAYYQNLRYIIIDKFKSAREIDRKCTRNKIIDKYDWMREQFNIEAKKYKVKEIQNLKDYINAFHDHESQ